MQNTEFISAVRRYVREEAISANLSVISDPPGRAPKTELVELSKWYNCFVVAPHDRIRTLSASPQSIRFQKGGATTTADA